MILFIEQGFHGLIVNLPRLTLLVASYHTQGNSGVILTPNYKAYVLHFNI